MSGSLVIKPLQAKLTRDTDTFTKMDPYCQVIIGSQTVKGKVCNSGGKNPHWDDSISVKRNNEPVLHLEVKDKDTFSSDEVIGVAQVDLTKLSGSSAQWYPLFYKQKPSGEILLEIIYTPDHGSQQGFPGGHPTGQQGFPGGQPGYPQMGYPSGQPIQTFAPTQNVGGYPQGVVVGGPGYGQPIVGGHGHGDHGMHGGHGEHGHKDKKHKDKKEKKEKKDKKEKKEKKHKKKSHSRSGSSSSGSDSD